MHVVNTYIAETVCPGQSLAPTILDVELLEKYEIVFKVRIFLSNVPTFLT